MQHDVAVLIGRFQPVHSGHLALLHAALAQAARVLVVLGSAHQARSPRNPFTWQERAQLLHESLPETKRGRVTALPVRDYYDEPRWAQAVRAAVARAAPAQARIALVGHLKDDTRSYLAAFPGWELVRVARQGAMQATPLRDACFGATRATLASALAAFGDGVPPATRGMLLRFAATPAYAALQEEWRALAAYRASWAQAPYPPVFVTVDALVRCQGQVLLIRRGHAPGKGLWALPGGFLEPRDTLWQSCLRELAEETACALPEPDWRAALRRVVVFDHPDRSQRGRTVTHVHAFDLGDAALPRVTGGDDAAQARWFAIDALPAMEETFFEDHFHILDHFLGLTGPRG